LKKFYKYLVIILIISVALSNCQKNSWPLTPSPPSGSSLGTIKDTLLFRASTTDPEGDNIAYQFDWGTEIDSNWSVFLDSGDSVTVTHFWQDTGHYNIRVRAIDIKDKVSRWSDPHLLSIVISIAPNIPSIFSGPDSGYINYSYTFSTTTTDPDGDSISYQFDWGDNNLSNWSSYAPNGDSVSMDHSWLSEGTYNIKVNAKDKYGLESGWSPEHSIIISIVPNLPPDVPGIPSGPANGYEDSTYTFSISTTDPDGDSITYQFDWGDGNYSEWSNYVSNGQSVSIDYSYSSEGTYLIQAKAKDKNEAESGWSDGHQISILGINPPNIPPPPTGPDVGYVNYPIFFSTSTTDPDEDSISYQFSWGDGDTTDWSNYIPSGQSISMTHSYSSEGTYHVKARAKDKTDTKSVWSDEHQISIITNNPPHIPPTLSGPSSGHEDNTYSFSTATTDPEGDSIAYQFDWGDGNLSYWSSYAPSGNVISMSHSWSSEGIYKIKVKAKDKNNEESDWSEEDSITIIRTRWTFSSGGYIRSSPAIGSDGGVYIGCWDNNLYAIHPDGTHKWTFPTRGIIYSSPAIGNDSTIYVSSDDSCLYAINPDGTEKWTFSTGGRVRSSPAIGSDGTIYVGSDDGNLYAINPYGTEKWRFSTERGVSSPAIGSDGTIYVGSGDGNLYAINPDGSEKWRFPTEWPLGSSPAIGSDGTIYTGGYDFYAINPDGSEKWTFLHELSDHFSTSPAIGSDGTIYVGASFSFYAINPDGTRKWRISISEMNSSPAIGKDGTIYVGSRDYNLYAINPDGSEKWTYRTGGIVYSSPAIGSDGIIYFGSYDNNIYAIVGHSGGLADTPWPMFRHDLRHTGRVENP